jgi:hypothetical protein
MELEETLGLGLQLFTEIVIPTIKRLPWDYWDLSQSITRLTRKKCKNAKTLKVQNLGGSPHSCPSPILAFITFDQCMWKYFCSLLTRKLYLQLLSNEVSYLVGTNKRISMKYLIKITLLNTYHILISGTDWGKIQPIRIPQGLTTEIPCLYLPWEGVNETLEEVDLLYKSLHKLKVSITPG